MKDLRILNDRFNGKWAHPEVETYYTNANSLGNNSEEDIYNLDVPLETRKAVVEADLVNIKRVMGLTEDSPSIKRAEKYTAPGCEEEPDTEVEVVIYRPEKAGKRKLPVLFNIPGGGMYATMVEMFTANPSLADNLNCVVVCPRYRNSFQAKYPAALNDCHAAYNWIVANAEKINIAPEKIVLFGVSSGSHLALSLAHRLKRYNLKPRGCVVPACFADYRPIFATSGILTNWSTGAMWKSGLQYLGLNNVSCYNDPEVFPNFATPEQCVGLCPTFMHPDTEDQGASACRAYQDTLTKAGVFNELHCWGGSSHGVILNASFFESDIPLVQRYISVLYGNIRDCWKYDLSRQWIQEELEDE